MVYTPQDFMRKMASAKKSISIRCQEAKNWLADARYEERHNLIVTSPDMTVDKWFTYWIENIVCDLAPNTKRNYRERYKWNIQPVLGTMFKSAVMNDIIGKHPMNGVRYTKPVRAVDDIKYLTVEEQEKFLEVAKRSHNYRQYVLLLETGLRTAELIGLTWDAINWKKHTLTISKSLEYRHSQGYWRAGPPKTKKSYRTILLRMWHTPFLKAVTMNGTAERSLMYCHRFWSTRTAEQEKRNALSCVIWCS